MFARCAAAAAITPPSAGQEGLRRWRMASIQRLVRLTQEDRSPPYLKMWAEEAAVRNYQRLMETARRMGYLEDGGRRLREAREDDPVERERERERMERRLREVRKLLGGV